MNFFLNYPGLYQPNTKTYIMCRKFFLGWENILIAVHRRMRRISLGKGRIGIGICL
jgi:hypothetical protein